MAQWMCLLRMESSMWVVIFCMQTQVDQLPAKRLHCSCSRSRSIFPLSLAVLVSGPMQLFSPIWTPGSLLAIKCMSTGTDLSGLAEISLRVSTSTLHIDRPPSCSTSTEQIAAGGTDSSVAGFNCDDVLETALALEGFYPV